MKRLLERKKKERADFKAQQQTEAADQQVRDDQEAADKKAKEAKDAADKKAEEEKDKADQKEKEFQAELKKEQALWNLRARQKTQTVPYPTTREHLKEIKTRRANKIVQDIKDKAERERKAKEDKATKDTIKADSRLIRVK